MITLTDQIDDFTDRLHRAINSLSELQTNSPSDRLEAKLAAVVEASSIWTDSLVEFEAKPKKLFPSFVGVVDYQIKRTQGGTQQGYLLIADYLRTTQK